MLVGVKTLGRFLASLKSSGSWGGGVYHTGSLEKHTKTRNETDSNLSLGKRLTPMVVERHTEH